AKPAAGRAAPRRRQPARQPPPKELGPPIPMPPSAIKRLEAALRELGECERILAALAPDATAAADEERG
ncbi:MAG TPA: hypothetical protein VHN20_04050, partial [Beijerinckiaceae bacterium]|nr:hypothetical protein [Beijerinckiaceae bacterium]